MHLTPTRRNLGRVAAILGIVEGLAWAAMSLASIIVYNWSPNLETPTTYGKLVQILLYNQFLSKDGNSTIQGVTFVIRPYDFTILMWIYFFVSVGWIALSADQFAAINYKKQRQTTIMIMWGILTIIISLIDLIFVCLLGRDYSACGESLVNIDITTNIDPSPYFCYLAVGIVMTLAARGYALWVVNVTLSFTMIYMSANLVKDETNWFSYLYNNDQSHTIPRVVIPKSNTSISSDRKGDISPNFFTNDDDTQLPSFLTRGDKFTY